MILTVMNLKKKVEFSFWFSSKELEPILEVVIENPPYSFDPETGWTHRIGPIQII